jgi:hypothetical protein
MPNRRGFTGSAGTPVFNRGTQTLAGVKAGRQGGPRTTQANITAARVPGTGEVVTRFTKAGALVLGDFIGQAARGDVAVDTNSSTAAWVKVGTQT